MSKLVIIPTPIGNLEDITLRAILLLKEVDLILAEDTRTSKKLLNHFKVQTPIFSFHQHNEHKTLNKWIAKLKEGETIALISDAGTPGISDPGFLLVRECLKREIKVFLPVKKGRQTRLKLLADEERTMVFYESPHRIVKTLIQFCDFFGEERLVSVSRELTKMYEETKRGSMNDVLHYFQEKKPKGEFVIVVEGKKWK